MARKRAVKTELLWVTPEMATQWLEKNENNRNLSQHRIARYAKDMKQGDWKITGDSIRFSKDGKLKRELGATQMGRHAETLLLPKPPGQTLRGQAARAAVSSQSIQEAVGRRIVRLTGPAHHTGHRREQHKGR